MQRPNTLEWYKDWKSACVVGFVHRVTRSHMLRVTGFRTPYDVTGFYMHVMVIHHVPLGFYYTTSHWVINMSLGYTPCITQFCINTCHWVIQPVSMHGYYTHITGPDIHQASLVTCHVLMHYNIHVYHWVIHHV